MMTAFWDIAPKGCRHLQTRRRVKLKSHSVSLGTHGFHKPGNGTKS